MALWMAWYLSHSSAQLRPSSRACKHVMGGVGHTPAGANSSLASTHPMVTMGPWFAWNFTCIRTHIAHSKMAA
jgi:hypothetical protein